MKDIILTGIRSNDEPTLGNYLGAFLPMVQLQGEKAGEYQLNMFVPDLHSFTTPIDHDQLYANTIKNLKYFVAAGIDINNPDTFIYRQSYIPAHSEMTWILDCFTYVGEMGRMTQFKDKSQSFEQFVAKDEKIKPNTIYPPSTKSEEAFGTPSVSGGLPVSVGLYNYPVLMAADILLYGAKWVPVGDDQKQHLEITRDIGERMNNKFGELFTVPYDWKKQLDFVNMDKGVRIRSLINPDKKMSKSISDPRGTILLSDDPRDAAKKVMGATTDSVNAIHFDWENQPGITNLLQILSLLSGRSQDEVTKEWEGNERYGDFKKAVASEVERFLTEFQNRFRSLDEAEVLAKLEAGEVAMKSAANETLLRVQRAVGLRPKA